VSNLAAVDDTTGEIVRLFSESFEWIKPLYNWGLQSEPRFAFGIPIHLFAFGLAIVGVAAFYFSEWIEQQVSGKGEYLQSPFSKAFSVATVTIAASMYV